MNQSLGSTLLIKKTSFRQTMIAVFWSIGLATLLLITNLVFPQYGYAATAIEKANPNVIQPFELTKPAATREEAYDEIAELNKDPKALIAAENQEEQAEENLIRSEERGTQSLNK